MQVLNTDGDAKYEAIQLHVEGAVTLQFGNRNAGPFEAFTSSAKTLPLLSTTLTLATGGHFTAGLNEFAFDVPLAAQREPHVLYETYHGVFVAINYAVRCEVRRSFLHKSLQRTQTFVVQNRPAAVPTTAGEEVNFTVSPESMVRSAKERIAIPRFLITGRLDRSEWCVTQPLTGQLTVQHTEVAIKSIECQLVRVETSGCAEGQPSDGERESLTSRVLLLDRFEND